MCRLIPLLLGIILETAIVSSRSEVTTYICGRLITLTYPSSDPIATRTLPAIVRLLSQAKVPTLVIWLLRSGQA